MYTSSSSSLIKRKKKGLWGNMRNAPFRLSWLEGRVAVCVKLTASGRLPECRCYTVGNERLKTKDHTTI